MNVLAIEYSSAQRSVAVLAASAPTNALVSSEAVETGGRAANTFGLVDEALRGAGLEREQIEVVAVGLGPGSYTGIRSAISFAQGWELARGVRVLGIPSTECLALEALAAGFRGKIGLVIDAQRNEVYLETWSLGSGEHRVLEPLRITSGATALGLREQGYVLVGPEPVRAVPDLNVVPARAMTLGKLALKRNDFIMADRLCPVYLRETSFVKAPPPRII
jgi:tRNA threonylcarbamoyladenosine biosynthesis protein TsaB